MAMSSAFESFGEGSDVVAAVAAGTVDGVAVDGVAAAVAGG